MAEAGNATLPWRLGALADRLNRLVEGRLWLKVIVGMALGVVTGVLLGPGVGWVRPGAAQAIVAWLALPGQIFLVLVQMIVVPLVFASIVRGIATQVGTASLRLVGIGGGLFFLATTIAATVIGIALALAVDPGAYIDVSQVRAGLAPAAAPGAGTPPAPAMNDLPALVVSLLPTNPLDAMASGQMLQIIAFAFVVGIALRGMSATKSAPLVDLLGSILEVCMTVVSWAIRLAPLAVFGLMTRLVATVGFGVPGPVNTPRGRRVAAPDAGPARREEGA